MANEISIKLNCSRPELQGFQDFFKEKMYPTLVELEESRAKAMNQVIRNGVLAVIPFVLAVIAYFALGLTFHQENLSTLLLIVGIYGALAIYFIYKPLNSVKAETKGFIMDNICSFLKINHSLRAEGFPFTLFKNAGLLPGHDRESLSDHIYGTYKGIDFNLAECKLTKTTRSRVGGKTQRFTENVYHGILISLKYPNAFTGETLISNDSGIFKNFFKGIQHGKKIELGHSGIDEKYLIHTTNEEEAREILSPERIEKIMNLVDHIGQKSLEIAFVDDRLLLSIKVDHDHFAINSMESPATCTVTIEYIIEELCMIFDLIDILDLESNTA